MLKEKLMELLKKKKREGAELSDVEKQAKMGVVKDLQDFAKESMGEGLKGVKKVTVAADSPEGLKAGLEKAEDIVEGEEESDDSEEQMSKEEIDMEIARLMELKQKLEE
jgi:membrane protease subunit (stomatin/prohibitin family)